ncbi:MAG: hypothetical protein K0R19_1776 [Bacillota bacterium]|jgi:predicted nucleic acid-binding protein|nr:hypothetical protein [Bacillota bacterium]
MHVILDTNIIVSDFYLRSPNFRLLFEYSDLLPYDIFLPEVVYDEVLNKYSEFLKKYVIEYEKSISQLKPLLIEKKKFRGIDINKQYESYKRLLDDNIETKRIKLIPYPKTSHKKIVADELARNKPFKQNGLGYRDKLIIDSIFEKFTIPEESVVFISNNKNDFGEEPNLFEDLFKNSNVKNTFNYKILNTLGSFVTQYIQPIKSINQEIDDILKLKKVTGVNIERWLLCNLKDVIYDIGHDIMCLDEGHGTILLHRIDCINSISVSEVTKLSRNEISCKIRIDGRFAMYVNGDQHDFLLSESWKDFFDYSLSEGDISISTWPLVNVKLTFSIVVDIKKKEVASYDPISVDSDYGATEYAW